MAHLLRTAQDHDPFTAQTARELTVVARSPHSLDSACGS